MFKLRTLAFVAVALLLSAGAVSAQNSIDVNGGAALEGNFGLEVTYVGGDNTDAYVESQEPANESDIIVEFLLNARNLSLNTSDSKFVIFSKSFKSVGAQKQHLFLYVKRNNAGTRNRFVIGLRRDNGSFFFPGGFALASDTAPDPTDRITVEWSKSNGGGSDGSIRVLRNGIERINVGGLSGYDSRDVDRIRFGNSVQTTLPNVSGSLAIDSVSISRP